VQQVGEHPLVICDTGHNLEGVAEVVKQIQTTPHHQLHLVIGLVKDKDVAAVLALFPLNAKWYFCQASIPRALPAEELHDKALTLGIIGQIVPDVNDAIALAKSKASPEDLIFVGGSTFVVAEVNNYEAQERTI